MATLLDPGQDERGKELADKPYVDSGLDQLESFANDSANHSGFNAGTTAPPSSIPGTKRTQERLPGHKDSPNVQRGGFGPDKTPSPSIVRGGFGSTKANPGSETGLHDADDPHAKKVRDERFGGSPMDRFAGQGGAAGALAGIGKAFANNLKKPKVMIGLILAIVTALLAVVGFILSIPLAIFNMANNLANFHFKVPDYVERKVSSRVLGRIMQEKQFRNGGAKQNTGRPIRDKIANMRIEKFNNHLQRQGIKLVFGEGANPRLIGIEKDGVMHTDLKDKSFWERRKAIGTLVRQEIAPWRVLKRISYTKLMRAHARVSFKFWTKEKMQDVRKTMTEKIRRGAPTTETDPRGTASEEERNRARANGSGDAADAIDEVNRNYAENGDKKAAIQAGARKLARLGYGITGLLSLVCTMQKLAEAAVIQGYIDRAELLIRAANIVLTMRDQLKDKDGPKNLDDFGAVMEAFSGDAPLTPSAAPASGVTGGTNVTDYSVATNEMDKKGWDQSAEAKRIADEPVNSDPQSPNYNPDLSPAANPDGVALLDIVSVSNKIINGIPGAQFACEVLTGPFGYVLMGVELAGTAITGGALAFASAAAKLGAMHVLFAVVVPRVLEAATNLAVTGTDNAVDSFNAAGAGLSLSAGDYARSFGGRQISDKEQRQMALAADADNIQIAYDKGWVWRTFALSNSQSLASRFMIKVPTSSDKVYQAIANIPHNFGMVFGSMFLGLQPVGAFKPQDINPHKFQFYGFTDAELDKYDFVENEACLAGISHYVDEVTGKTVDQPQCAIPAGSKTRLQMLGDPANFKPTPAAPAAPTGEASDNPFAGSYSAGDGDDPNLKDFLHCFVNKFRTPIEIATNDPICHSIGSVTGDQKSGSKADNPTDQEIVDKIYCENNNVCDLKPIDDFLRYRLQLLYNHETDGAVCLTTDEDCLTPTVSVPGATAPGAGAVSGDAKVLAKQILDMIDAGKLSLQVPDINRPDLEKTAAGNNITSCGLNAPLNTSLLKLIVQLSQKYTFSINSLVSSHACDGKFHPQGRAVDIGNVNGVAATAANMRGTPYQAAATYIYSILPAGGGLGQVNDPLTHAVCLGDIPHPATIRVFDDTCDHLHLDAGATAP